MAEIEVINENEAQNYLMERGRKVFLAGVGAVTLVKDEAKKLSQKFIEEGETTEMKGRKRFEKLVDSRKKEIKKARRQAENRWNKRTEGILHRFNVPTRSEIKSLNTKLTRLTKKVDELAVK